MMQLERSRVAQQRLAVLAQDVLRKHPQILILEALRALIERVVHLLGRIRGAGHKLRHIHRLIRPNVADAVDLELLLLLPEVDGGAHFDNGIGLIGAMLLRRIIPKLGGAFPACIREDKIKIVAALDVALLRNALDDAVPFHLVRCGVMDFRKQMHPAHGDSSVRMFYDVFYYTRWTLAAPMGI